MIVTKIISGMQTGADQGGVEAAKRLGLETGGTMPKGFRTEDGPRPEFAALYNATEHPSAQYTLRTVQNVCGSDATVVFGDFTSPGSKQTIAVCKSYSKPVFCIGFLKLPEPHTASIRQSGFRDWLFANNIQTLNVAGNRESKRPGIQDFVENFLYDALR